MKTRLFLTCWAVFSLYFATNVVREHFPAFSLIEDGSFRVDAYADLHSDIFQHRDGHYYIGNQVLGSVIAAVPLKVFEPVLDAMVREPDPEPGDSFKTEYSGRAEFMRKARKRGLHLRFGAATAITSVFLMAPLSALFTVIVFSLLLERGVGRARALWLALLFAFATPIFYRTSYLNHNVFLAYAIFLGFLLLRPGDTEVPSTTRRFWSGFCGGFALALDYAGVVPLLVFFGCLLWSHRRPMEGGLRSSHGRSLGDLVRLGMPYVLGSVPPVLFLLYSQYAMYGHAIYPGQHWMPDVNWTEEGWRGFGLPDPQLFLLNLVDGDWGLFTFGPLLLFALIPIRGSANDAGVTGKRERAWIWWFVFVFLVFNAGNQYSRMQWNTGFRYLLPVVPFLFVLAADHLRRMPRGRLIAISAVTGVHSWVLTMVRYTPVPARTREEMMSFVRERPAVLESWERVFQDGITFPWLSTLRNTAGIDFPLKESALLPWLVLAVGAGVVFAIWRFPTRSRRDPAPPSAGG